MPRNSINRKYCPRFEEFEGKQLLSAGLLNLGLQALMQPPAPVSSQAEQQDVILAGTGKGIVIITS